MKANATERFLLALILMLCVAAGQTSASEVEIGELSFLDRSYMQQQRELVADLCERNLGRKLTGDRDNDLALLQTMLDRGIVRKDQTRELQAMGLVMGDLLADELGLDWVIYEDELGRSRALRYKQVDHYLFPMTMIARRREAGNTESVVDIYNKALENMSAHIEPLPFQ